MGSDGPRLIKTVSRRGYLFDPPAAAPPARGRQGWAGIALAGALLAGGFVFSLPSDDAPAGIDQAIRARRSIAVMPFAEPVEANTSYFAAAVAEDLITDLARLPDTRVIAQASAAAVAQREADPRKIGRELGVRYVLSGSLRREGGAVRIQAQFTSSDSGAVLWSERFEYARTADWAWQRDIGLRVARALDLQMSAAAAPAAARGTKRLDAIEATLRGQHLLRRSIKQLDVLEARMLFETALKVEPDAASALVGLAESYLSEIDNGWSHDRNGRLGAAEQAIDRALQIDPDYALAHCAKGHVLHSRNDIAGAEQAYRRVLALNPSEAWGRTRLAGTLIGLGRFEEVAQHVDAALRLNPLEGRRVAWGHLIAGMAEFHLDRDESAYEHMRAAAAADPTQKYAWLWMAAIDGWHGRKQQAARDVEQVLRLYPLMDVRTWGAKYPIEHRHPRAKPGRERFEEGLRRAGLPE